MTRRTSQLTAPTFDEPSAAACEDAGSHEYSGVHAFGEIISIRPSRPLETTEALRESETRLWALLSSLDDLVFELDENGPRPPGLARGVLFLSGWRFMQGLLRDPRSAREGAEGVAAALVPFLKARVPVTGAPYPSLGAASGIAQCRITGAQIRQYVLAMTDDEQVDEVRAWFTSKGFDVRAEERDMSDELRGPTAKHGFWVDLVSRRSGGIAHHSYGSGPSATLAIVAAEQRWLVEQDGSGSTAGATYADKARERLRRMRETAP